MLCVRLAVVSFFTLVSCQLLTAQSQWAEVRLTVTDATGLALPSDVKLVSEATRTERTTKTNDAGEFDFQHVPFGLYHLTDHARRICTLFKRVGFACDATARSESSVGSKIGERRSGCHRHSDRN